MREVSATCSLYGTLARREVNDQALEGRKRVAHDRTVQQAGYVPYPRAGSRLGLGINMRTNREKGLH